MNYVRTSAGGMMAITPKSNTIIAVKKQRLSIKPVKKSAKNRVTGSK